MLPCLRERGREGHPLWGNTIHERKPPRMRPVDGHREQGQWTAPGTPAANFSRGRRSLQQSDGAGRGWGRPLRPRSRGTPSVGGNRRGRDRAAGRRKQGHWTAPGDARGGRRSGSRGDRVARGANEVAGDGRRRRDPADGRREQSSWTPLENACRGRLRGDVAPGRGRMGPPAMNEAVGMPGAGERHPRGDAIAGETRR